MKKELAFVGLGRMGLAMANNLIDQGYIIHGFDTNPEINNQATAVGITTHDSLSSCVGALTDKKTLWLMVPAQYVDDVLDELLPLLTTGDTVIDGGNSFFKKSLERHHRLDEYDIHFVDCGTSGGMEGARHGASLMVGGEKDVIAAHTHIFEALATEGGYGHVGGPGAGHFVKMIHNGIEYGMMGAIAEGMNVLHEHKTALDLNIMETLKPYNHGSIIDSSLMRWVGNAYHTEGYLESIAGEVPCGETEMEMEYLVNHEEVMVLEAALNQRKETRHHPSFIGTLISAMRNQFGGHKTVLKKGGEE